MGAGFSRNQQHLLLGRHEMLLLHPPPRGLHLLTAHHQLAR
jgi:hypothetical protein